MILLNPVEPAFSETARRVTNNPRQYVQNGALFEILDSYILDDGTEMIYECRIVPVNEYRKQKEPIACPPVSLP